MTELEDVIMYFDSIEYEMNSVIYSEYLEKLRNINKEIVMTETEKHIKRIYRIGKVQDDYWREVHKLETKRNAKTRLDEAAETDLFNRCKKALFKRLKDNHTCKCCDVEYPYDGDMHVTDSGMFFYRFDADHPNDIIDFEINIDKLLSEEKSCNNCGRYDECRSSMNPNFKCFDESAWEAKE